MDECKVIIMGFGSVGQGVANALSMKKELIKEKTGVEVKVVAAADSSTSAISQDGLDENTKAVLNDIYQYSQSGIHAANLENHIEAHQQQLSSWVQDIGQYS